MTPEEIKFDHIQSVNYWDGTSPRLGFIRQIYLQQILGYIGTRLLKVLLGQRRSGKSTILKQIIAELISQGTNPKNILYLNFELHELRFVQKYDALENVIKLYIKKLKPKGKIYLFFDEIQEVEQTARAIPLL